MAETKRLGLLPALLLSAGLILASKLWFKSLEIVLYAKSVVDFSQLRFNSFSNRSLSSLLCDLAIQSEACPL